MFLLAGPSGAGKTTLLDKLRENPDFVYSISCTTRAPRPDEINGRDYLFLSEEDFKRRLANNEFLEHALVHRHHYGTLRETVTRNLDQGIDVLLDVDIQGAAKIRAHDNGALRDYLVDVFLTAPNLEVLRKRLAKRGTETPEMLEIRIQNAVTEMQHWRDYRYTILSGTADDDLENFRAIMQAERCASARLAL